MTAAQRISFPTWVQARTTCQDRSHVPAFVKALRRVRHVGVDLVEASASADQQHELPAHVTALAHAVRLRDLGEREGLRDREREAPELD